MEPYRPGVEFLGLFKLIYGAASGREKIEELIAWGDLVKAAGKLPNKWKDVLLPQLEGCLVAAVTAAHGMGDGIGDLVLAHLESEEIDISWMLTDLPKTLQGAQLPEADLATLDGGNHAFILENYVKGCVGWTNFVVLCSDTGARCLGLIEAAKGLATASGTLATNQQKTFVASTGKITAAQATVQARLTERPALTQCLAPVIGYLNGELNAMLGLLAGCDGAGAVTVIMSCVPAGSMLDVVKKDTFGPAVMPLFETCSIVDGRVDRLLAQISKEVLDTLAAGRVATLKQLLDVYGAVGFVALTAFTIDTQRTILERFPALRADILRFAPANSPLEHVKLCFARSASGRTDADAVGIITKGLVQQVNVPKGIVVSGWQFCGGFNFPMTFSAGALSTDQACIKHVRQETGLNPSLAKLNSYFAEMVQACIAAGAAWAQAGRPARFSFRGRVGNAVWHILLNSGPDAIFHIDSGYENSWWWSNG